jgi:hypothetical protein
MKRLISLLLVLLMLSTSVFALPNIEIPPAPQVNVEIIFPPVPKIKLAEMFETDYEADCIKFLLNVKLFFLFFDVLV